ncbi:MAG: cytochrome c [Gallionellaceae bacterium]|nr:cytochrome c [Gallionellaceae bacterium]
MKKFALAILCAAISTSAFAGKEEDQQIKVRQSAYTFMAWNVGKIKAQVIDRPEAYDKNQVIAAANAIAAVANSGLSVLFGPGTDQGTGWKKTRLKPEFFKQPDEVRKLATDFNREANELAKVAQGGNVGDIKAQFGKLGEACKACHDKFRVKED